MHQWLSSTEQRVAAASGCRTASRFGSRSYEPTSQVLQDDKFLPIGLTNENENNEKQTTEVYNPL